MTNNYDLIVIGGGPAGSEAAFTANENGAHVAVIERDHLGGTCLNYGCDPTKTLLYIANLVSQTRRAENYGLRIPSVEVEWPAVLAFVQQALEKMRGGTFEEARDNMRERGIDLYIDEAKFVSPFEVSVSDQTIRGERILIAAGTETLVPPVDGLEEAGYITNVEAVSLPNLPSSLAVVGGGPVGIEFAQMFSRFGVDVTVFEQEPRILPTEDHELTHKLADILVDEGIRLETGAKLQRVQQRNGCKQLTFSDNNNGPSEQLTVEEILLAVGRRPALDKLNIKAAGVELNKKGVVVDETLRTTVPHIWAAGDITGGYQFTHVATPQGRLVAHNAFSEKPKPFDDQVIPWATYTYPALAHVGKTEEQLQEAGVEYEVARLSLDSVERAIAMGQADGLIKLLVDPHGKILGGHTLAPQGAEILAPVVLAMSNDLSVETLAEAILPYPTLVEGVKWAAQSIA